MPMSKWSLSGLITSATEVGSSMELILTLNKVLDSLRASGGQSHP
jgi:hypothetical protein